MKLNNRKTHTISANQSLTRMSNESNGDDLFRRDRRRRRRNRAPGDNAVRLRFI